MKFSAELRIDRRPDEVWRYAADVERHTEWMTVTDAAVTRGDGRAVGSRGREGMNLGPFHFDAEFEVTESEPGRRIRWRAVGGVPVGLEVELVLAPHGPDATHATYRSDVGLRGLWMLGAPLIAMEGRAGVQRELRRLKERVEAAPVSAPEPAAAGPA